MCARTRDVSRLAGDWGALCFTELWGSVLLGRFLVGLRKSIFEAREAVHQGRVVQQAR